MKSLQVVHPSFAVYVGVLAAALVVIGLLVATSRAMRGHMARLGKCAIAGLAAATALVVYVNGKHHAQLAASAAKPVNGQRLPVAYILADGFVFTAVVVTVVLFAVVTLAGRGRRESAAVEPAQRHPVRTGRPG